MPLPDAQSRLIEAVLEVLATQGLAGLSARTLGEEAGVSASAVNYHFGGREALLAQSYGVAAADARAWRRARLAAAPQAAPPDALAEWLPALVQDLCGRPRVVLAAREFRQMALRLPALLAVAQDDQADSDAFWSEVCRRCGLPAPAGPVAGDFAAGATVMHGPGADWAEELPWLTASCARLAARLGGRRGGLPGWDGWRAEVERRAAAEVGAWSLPASDAARRMLAAAAETLGRRGIEGLTHRAVAAAAGTSLANATHHFPTRAALGYATFRYLHLRATEAGAAGGRSRPPGRTPAQFADGFVDFLLGEGEDLSPVALALEELILAAAREPALTALSRQLRAGRGEGTAVGLETLTSAGDRPDRLDAHLTSMVLSGGIRGVYGLAAGDRAAWLRPRLRGNLAAMFG